jgi:diamine N-acetyltransferase
MPLMEVRLTNGKTVNIRQLAVTDAVQLSNYFAYLSADTKKRFAPHSFNWHMVEQICSHQDQASSYFIAETKDGCRIIAYSIVRRGLPEHDIPRLFAYGLPLEIDACCTFAPSVADAWQGAGLGGKILDFIAAYLKQQGVNAIILQGGVQCSNQKAVSFYCKSGFQIVGTFEHNGLNFDMLKNI